MTPFDELERLMLIMHPQEMADLLCYMHTVLIPRSGRWVELLSAAACQSPDPTVLAALAACDAWLRANE